MLTPDVEALGKEVRAVSAANHGITLDLGVIVAVADFPTYVIQRADGTTFNWGCHITREIEPDLTS